MIKELHSTLFNIKIYISRKQLPIKKNDINIGALRALFYIFDKELFIWEKRGFLFLCNLFSSKLCAMPQE